MKFRKMIVFTLILAITLLSIGPAMAQEPPPPPPACPVGDVSGTVVGADPETGVVIIELADGTQCAVTVNMEDIDPEGLHPIVYLLGQYFHNPTIAELKSALDFVEGCAENSEDENCSEENLQKALETLIVAWTLDENGSPTPVSEQIAAYHEEGMGFGVLVKLYAIADESVLCQAPECTADTLVELFKTGQIGMGQIFHEYGKPEKLGVGHVRQAMTPDKEKGKDKNKGGDEQTGEDQSSQTLPPAASKKDDKPLKDNNNGLKGICNAISKGGKPKAGVNCGP
jgi:hypothetical protein